MARPQQRKKIQSNDDVIQKLTPMIESLVDRHTPEHYNSGGKNPEIRNTHWKSVSRAHDTCNIVTHCS